VPSVSVTTNGSPLPSQPTAVQSRASEQLTEANGLPSPIGGISVTAPQVPFVSVAAIPITSSAAVVPSALPTAVQLVADEQLTLLK
jgi:hypothetical protein